MKKIKMVETIPVAALSEATPRCVAMIVNATGSSSIIDAINSLYFHSAGRVFCVEPGVNQLTKTLEICRELSLRTIVLLGEELPEELINVKITGDSIALVSPGSDNGKTSIPDFCIKSEEIIDFAHIGYQLYRYNPKTLRQLRANFFEEMRLGTIRNDISLAEPLIRSKESLFLDIKCVRSGDFPENKDRLPNGLFAQELCQLARYIGMGQSLIHCFLYGFPNDFKKASSTPLLVAETVWHIIEALSSNIPEDPGVKENDEHFLRKIVSMGQEGQDLIFITSKNTGRWWMEIQDINSNQNHYIPCSFSDYQAAFGGEIPLRWLFFYQKINPI